MTLRLEMLQAARLAPSVLGESTGLIRGFFLRQQNDDGGFRDRAGKSDLYYTVFGLDGLAAVQGEARSAECGVRNTGHEVQPAVTPDSALRTPHLERAGRFLRSYGEGAGLDYVHLCCLARAWAALAGLDSRAEGCPAGVAENILCRIEGYRSKDGGYNPVFGSEFGTAYGAFLALGAYQDLTVFMDDSGSSRGEPAPYNPAGQGSGVAENWSRLTSAATKCMIASLKALETPDGAYTNCRSPVVDHQSPIPIPLSGATNATAAAVAVLRHLGVPAAPSAGQWLLSRAHPHGGFLAMPGAPMPDLLSTATALHALAGLQTDFDGCREKCLDFIDSLWTNEGGFYGHWGDEYLDCEYTFYALVALGHLSSKSEIRNLKSETNSKSEIQRFETPSSHGFRTFLF